MGIPHVFAVSVEDAYRGMGYAAGFERLWQIHLSTLYARGEVAAVLGRRFLVQDAVHRAFDVPAERLGIPDSPGDYVVDAYLDGLNAYVDSLAEVPPEFAHAGVEPRHYTRADVAARYRFTSWFQQSAWTDKILLGRLMATHGIEWWRGHVRRLSSQDEAMIQELSEPLQNVDPRAVRLLYPDALVRVSGSNNWAVQGRLSMSGKPMLATDPHQPHSIPNTFFYAHLSAPGWDAFGASFPGVPYFMMGYTRRLAWGLTTGFVDNHDVYVERMLDGDRYESAAGPRKLEHRAERIEIKGESAKEIPVASTHHGPLLEPLMTALDLAPAAQGAYRTSVRWELAHHATSAGALARLPLADTAAEFGEALFENDVCPLVNNIICIDRDDDLRRYIAATLPHRVGYTGTVPLAGWRADCEFESSRAADLLVEHNPRSGFCLTANNDTMGDDGPYPIHNFPIHGARAERIREMLEVQGDGFRSGDFRRMQLDLLDVRARELVPQLVEALSGGDKQVQIARSALSLWDGIADGDAQGACIFYPLLDRRWHIEFMSRVLNEPLLDALPEAAPGLVRWQISDFLAPGSPWVVHRKTLRSVLEEVVSELVTDLKRELGDDPDRWRYRDLHKVQFWHSLRKHDAWKDMQVGPDPIGGSTTTLGMAMHMGPGPGHTQPGQVPMRVYHGPAYRLIVDLATPERCEFVIAGGNSGRPGSPHVSDHYPTWLKGDYFELTLDRDKIAVEDQWSVTP